MYFTKKGWSITGAAVLGTLVLAGTYFSTTQETSEALAEPSVVPGESSVVNPILQNNGVTHPASKLANNPPLKGKLKQLLSGDISTVNKNELLALAQQRQSEMKSLLASDPRQAMKEALSLSEYAALPSDIAALVEKPFSSQIDIVVLPNESKAGSHSFGLGGNQNTVQAKLEGDSAYHQLISYGGRESLTSKRGLLGQGFTLDGQVVLDDQPLKVVDKADRNFVLENFPVAASSVSNTDFYTADSIASDPVIALAGGHIFYFSSTQNVRALNTELLSLEQNVGPNTGSQVLLTLAKSTNSVLVTPLSFSEQVVLLGRDTASTWATSPKKSFYIRVNFSDKPSEPVTKAALETELNGDTASLITAMSRGKTAFTASVSDEVITLPNSSGYYRVFSDAALHDDAVAAYKDQSNAVSLDDYDIVGVYFTNIGKDYTGLASIGGGLQWLQDTLSTRVIVHELGHNYGLGHANFWVRNDGGVVAGSGLSEEYGDIFDIMGRGDAAKGHFHPQALSKLGWLTGEQWKNVSTTSTHRLYRFDQPGQSGTQGLRIPRGDGDYYWVGYRGSFTNNEWLSNGLNIIWQPSGYEQSWLIDTTPDSFEDSTEDKKDAGIVIGRTYSDAEAAIHITPIEKGNNWIDVKVTIGNAGNSSAPEVTLDYVAQATARTAITYSALASDSDDEVLAYHWQFGDHSAYSNSPEVSYSWPTGGSKDVSVTVSDMRGKMGKSTAVVEITDPLQEWEQTAIDLTSSNLKLIATNGTKVVAAGDDSFYGTAVVLTSTDGKTWSDTTTWKDSSGNSVSSTNMHFEGLTFSHGKWWLVGRNYDFSLGDWVGLILNSTNGSDWVVSHTGGLGLYGVAAGNNKIVAVGHDGTILVSANGITWSSKNKTSADFSEVAFGDGRFIAVGLNEYSRFDNTDGVVLSSTNSLTWTAFDESGSLPSINTITYVNGRFIGSGFVAGIRVMADGENVFSLTQDTSLNYGPTAFAADDAGVFLALGDTTENYLSQNGERWFDLELDQQSTRNALVYFKNGFISVGDEGEVYRTKTSSVRPPSCTEVVTHAWNPNTGEERDFSTPCDVLTGWVVGEAPDNDNDGQNDVIDADDDNDGMPDTWEAANNLDPLDANDASFDTDGDGVSNKAEYLAGTNPQQSNAKSYACNVINDPSSSTRRWGINQYNLATLPSVTAEEVYSMGQNRKIQSVACDPSGGNILFSMKDSLRGDYEIYELDVASGSISQVTDNDTDDVDVTRSRNGLTIAWQKRLDDNRQAIELIHVDGNNGGRTLKTLASASPFVQPSLSPNGDWLTFVQLRTNFFAVMRYDITNNKYKEVHVIARRKKLYHPSITDDGNKVGWSERVSQRRYRVKDLTENTTIDLLNNADGVEHAVLSGDGESVIYSVNSEDIGETYITSVETLDTQVVGETLITPSRYLSSSWIGY